MTGHINVDKFGMTCSADYITNSHYIHSLAGGLYSGIIHLIIGGMLWYYGAWGLYVPIISLGAINFAYGFWEAEYGAAGRYKIYLFTTLIMIIFWSLYTLLWL